MSALSSCVSSRLSLLAVVLALTPGLACKGAQEDQAAGANAKPGSAASTGADSVSPPQTEVSPTANDSGPLAVDTDPLAGEDRAETGDETGDSGEPVALPETFAKVGVAACDDYIAAYEACIAEKVPEGEREAQRRLVFENVEAWTQTAKGGSAAEQGLQTACKIATEQAKRATQAWGCAW